VNSTHGEKINLFSKYLGVINRLDLKIGQNYGRYKNINKNEIDWTHQEMKLTVNDHQIHELTLDLTNTTLLGSSDSFDLLPEVLNRYRIIFDIKKLKRDSYNYCKKNSACSKYVKASDSDILDHFYNNAYENISSKAMTNAEWEKARQEAEAYQ
jgi:hypothetical protein